METGRGTLGKYALFLVPAALAAQCAFGSGRFVPGEVVVKFRDTLTAHTQDQALFRHGALKMRDLGREGWSHVRLLEGQSVEAAVDSIAQNPDVEYVQPNFIYRMSLAPDDTNYGQLWGLKNTGQTIVSPGGPDSPDSTYNPNPGTVGRDMGLEAAWDQITDCSSVTVAVVDTGVNYNHADLAANMWDGGVANPNHGWNFVENNNDPMDKAGHGTHVAGTIGAVGNNTAGSVGVCWNVKLMAVRVLDATGSGTTANIVSGMNFAADNGAKVINMSLGGGTYDAAFDASITNAQNHGIVVVVAAGNDTANNDSTATYPCNYKQSTLVCVAALDQKYGLASFSNYGAKSVHVGAPGVNIVSEWPGTVTVHSDPTLAGWTMNGGWGYFAGTSRSYLANPSNWDYATKKYANNADDRVYKTFDTTGAAVALLNLGAWIATETNYDFFKVAYKNTAADPFVGGTPLDSMSGRSDDYIPFTYDITPCIGATCTVGFQLTSDGSQVDFGVILGNLTVEALAFNTTSYNVISGTSMATPHVSGLAAMLFAYNPAYTAADVVNSIKNGGVAVAALAGKTTSGKAAHAMGSLSYISPPTGVKATIQ